MTDVMELIQRQLTGQVLDNMSEQLGTNPLQTASAAQSAINVLLGALTKNSSNQDGASALAGALERDHDGSALDDILGSVMGSLGSSPSKSLNGAGILGHILGTRQNPMIDMIGRMTGMDKSSTGRLMMMLAPIVMGALGKTKKEENLDTGGLSDLLRNTTTQQREKSAQMDIFSKMLDADGDGSAMDDLLKMGGSILGSFLKR